MPLSEHEQRLLDQLEQQLHAEDPKFAHTLSSVPSRALSTRNMVIGVLILILGLLTLLAGVSMQIIPLGIAGFIVMGGGVYFALRKQKYAGTPVSGEAPRPGHQQKQKSGFMTDLENKWEERRREQ